MLHTGKFSFATPDLPDNISIAGTSAELRPELFDVVVTLPTFRRPEQVVATLDSLAAQHTKHRFAVIVIENDAEAKDGVASAMRRLGQGDLHGLVIVAHDRGNCSAYNAGWLTALAVFPNFRTLMVIDDDELAGPGWIDQMNAALETFDVGIVGGPQVPVFEGVSAKDWHEHPVFAPPYAKSGPVPALYSSGNLAIKREVLEMMGPPFLDLRFNFLGGGDSDFLSRASQKGVRLAWCAEAPVHEAVPARRLEADWIRARALRNGMISTLVEQKKRADEPFGRLRVVAKSFALLAASPLRAAMRLLKARSLSAASYPMLVGLGRVLAEFGYQNEQYRNAEKN